MKTSPMENLLRSEAAQVASLTRLCWGIFASNCCDEFFLGGLGACLKKTRCLSFFFSALRCRLLMQRNALNSHDAAHRAIEDNHPAHRAKI